MVERNQIISKKKNSEEEKEQEEEMTGDKRRGRRGRHHGGLDKVTLPHCWGLDEEFLLPCVQPTFLAVLCKSIFLFLRISSFISKRKKKSLEEEEERKTSVTIC